MLVRVLAGIPVAGGVKTCFVGEKTRVDPAKMIERSKLEVLFTLCLQMGRARRDYFVEFGGRLNGFNIFNSLDHQP